MNIFIEPISIDDVYMYGSERFNTNNHWKNNVQPSDYYEILEKTNTKNWIHKFKDQYLTIDIDPVDILWLKEAFKIGRLTGQFPKMYEENLNQMIQKYKYLDHFFTDKKYFVKINNVSLKYGKYGCGPYTNFENIIESCVSSIDGHSPINTNTTNLRIYLIPWITIDDDKEFRVFINNNKITCISQQNIYQTNHTITNHTEKNVLIEKWMKIIVDYFNQYVRESLTDIGNYSIDIALINNDDNLVPYLIELNSFGTEYAAGSALFHWIIDADKLYNSGREPDNSIIYFRYCY